MKPAFIFILLLFWPFNQGATDSSAPSFAAISKNQITLHKRPFIPVGINYYPKNKIWEDFWLKYDHQEVETDLDQIRSLGFNSMRIFLGYKEFADPTLGPKLLSHVKRFLDASFQRQLLSIVTLFDWGRPYPEAERAGTQQSLKAVVSALKNHPGILAWDVKNEPDLDYRFYENKETVNSWLSYVVKTVRSLDPNHMITIGWLNAPTDCPANQEVDFLSFHHYEKPSNIPARMAALQKAYPTTPIVLGEVGQPTIPDEILEKQQNEFVSTTINNALVKGAAGFYLWTLHDFDPRAGRERPARENHFGILKGDGSPKKSAAMLRPGILLSYPALGTIQKMLFEKAPLTVCFQTGKESAVNLTLVDPRGRSIRAFLTKQKLPAGLHCKREFFGLFTDFIGKQYRLVLRSDGLVRLGTTNSLSNVSILLDDYLN